MEKICNILTTISDKKYFSMIILFIEKKWLNTYVHSLHSLALTKKKEKIIRIISRHIPVLWCFVHVCFVQVTILKLVWRSRRADAPRWAHFPTDICSVIQEG